MPFYSYDTLKVNYKRQGKGQPVVLLHGWGASLQTFDAIFEDLSKKYDVLSIDFPGFGASDEPSQSWNLSEYTDFVEKMLKDLNIQNPVLIGHSFGGRVAIKLEGRIRPKAVVLVNSAGIKPKRAASYYLKVYGFKAFRILAGLPGLKWILAEPLAAYRELYSSSDYKQASPIMKQVLSKVVNEDLRAFLPNFEAPVLLVWGDQDTSTPIEDAKLMSEMIPDAGLVVFEGAGHFSYLEQPARFSTIINTFIGGI
jgi:pimeloyl-ACP methyl ester carboxylesterase